MGERLNIEIIKGGKPVANAFYNWGAYTTNSLSYIKDMVEFVNKENILGMPAKDYAEQVIQAVKVLEATGARIQKDELQHLKKLDPYNDYKVADNRCEGLIYITREEMMTTREAEVGRVEFDIDIGLIYFDVYFIVTRDEYESERDEEMPEFDDHLKWEFDFAVSHIPITEFDKVDEFFDEVMKRGDERFLYRDEMFEFQ